MTRSQRSSTVARKARVDVYQMVTDRFIKMLERGELPPWTKGWDVTGTLAPRNGQGRRYRGINVWILAATAQEQGYRSPFWLTFNQVKKYDGASVRKGEKGTHVILWKPGTRTVEDAETGEPTDKRYLLLRYFTVFNADQCDGLPERFHPVDDAPPRDDSYYLRPAGNPQPVRDYTAAEQVVREYIAPATDVNGDRDRPYMGIGQPAYAPGPDIIYMPPRERFHGGDEYYSTLFHEMGHSTGHSSRLARAGIVDPIRFGTEKYAQEELVAEVTAGLLCSVTGVHKTVENQAAYISHWLGVLREDSRVLVTAAAQAQKAADLILGTEPEPIVTEED